MYKIPKYFGDISNDDINDIMNEYDFSDSVEEFQKRKCLGEKSNSDRPYKRGPKIAGFTITSSRHIEG